MRCVTQDSKINLCHERIIFNPILEYYGELMMMVERLASLRDLTKKLVLVGICSPNVGG